MANKYPLVSNSSTLTIEEIPIGDTLLVDNIAVTGNGNIVGNLVVGGNVTVNGSINANLGNVIVENLTVEGKTNLNNVANITITGGSNNYVLRTNGAGNLTWANIQSEIANAGGLNTYVQYNNNGLFGGSANFVFNSSNNTLTLLGTGQFLMGHIITTETDNLIALHSNLGLVSNVKILGGSNGYVLSTNGSGNLSWVEIDPSVSGNGGNAYSSVLLLASLNGGNAISA